MKRPAEKLYRVKVTIVFWERAKPGKEAINHMTANAVKSIVPGQQRFITLVEIKRRFRV